MKFSFKSKMVVGLFISLYIMFSSGDFYNAMNLFSISWNVGVAGSGSAGLAILFSYLVIGPVFIAILIVIAVRVVLALMTMLGIKKNPRKRSPKFATRAEKQIQDNAAGGEFVEIN